MEFVHPHARNAKIYSTAGINGKSKKLLVIVTPLVLDKENPKFKLELLDKLSDAAREWVENHPGEASDYMLMNRPKKWIGDKDT